MNGPITDDAAAVIDSASGKAVKASLEVIDIHKAFGSISALNGISLTVRQGEIVGLFGPDGAGKTVSFYCMLGLLKPDSGRIIFRGKDISDLPFYRRAILGLGYLPEQPSIFRGLTVAQNVQAMLEIAEPDPKTRQLRLDELLAGLNIEHLRDACATSLSGGERRRCEVARALALDPAIILLDEPFAGIDPLTIASIKELVLEMKSRNIGVLLTDQNVPEMLQLIDEAYVIDEGSMIFHGSPEDMLCDREVMEHYLGVES
ncbi:LPS export ABC transporter ATP-binding protein [Altererythrobacter sp. ZODW24]|uniref:LPS export ABC transporter ATP-binding protein n=1 Tax=Altererythrobacter sp. ZODW24 TaxID=2185142 RepID=UPI000DF7DD98|nr:LPS export ABC transporter ATP-binding protein [Altererythrobacter sp. ZODW24]